MPVIVPDFIVNPPAMIIEASQTGGVRMSLQRPAAPFERPTAPINHIQSGTSVPSIVSQPPAATRPGSHSIAPINQPQSGSSVPDIVSQPPAATRPGSHSTAPINQIQSGTSIPNIVSQPPATTRPGSHATSGATASINPATAR